MGMVEAWEDVGHTVRVVDLSHAGRSLLGRSASAVVLHLRHRQLLASADVLYTRMHPLGPLTATSSGAEVRAVEVNGVPADYGIAHPTTQRVSRYIRLALLRQLRDATHLFPVTEGLARWLLALPGVGARVDVVPNAVDPERFHPESARPADVPDRYVVFFGALAPWQGLDLLLRACAHRSWPSDVPLLVIGDGHLREQVACAEKAGLPVRFLGWRSREQMPGYVAGAELSIVPKQYHDPGAGQSPLKLYESLACGTPVVATPLHGATDVPGLESGVVTVRPSFEDVARTVAGLLRDPESLRQRGEEVRRVIVREHTWDHRARRVLEAIGA
jgi:glycosyltransferase involved in cell wall biosynthesis